MRTLLGLIPVIAAALCCSSHGPEPAPAVRRAAAPTTCGSRCGTERWLVKTFADPDRDQVDLNPHRTSVANLAALARPGLLPDAGRALPTERTTFVVQAYLAGWSPQADGDIHLILADPDQPRVTMARLQYLRRSPSSVHRGAVGFPARRADSLDHLRLALAEAPLTPDRGDKAA